MRQLKPVIQDAADRINDPMIDDDVQAIKDIVVIERKVKEAIQSHLEELNFYPETGSPMIKEAISKHLNVEPSRTLFGAGLDEVILMISRAVLTAGDKIVTSDLH